MADKPPSEGDGNSGGSACFLSGTRIAVPEGSVRVEDLAVGALVLTFSGESRPVRWLGHRGIDCSRYREPSSVWPYRIRAGAFAEGKPERDLWVSQGHSIFIDGALIQVERLANDATIAIVPRDQVEYWHVELDRHDVVLAEGLPAESYLDVGNRQHFENGGAFIEAYPDFLPRHESETCAPIVKDGPLLERIKTTLIERAKVLGYRLSHDSDLYIAADGRRIEPARVSATQWEFRLPEAQSLELRSRTFVPSRIKAGSDDSRSLGVAVTKLELDGVSIALDSETIDYWHELEQDAAGQRWRWSTGNDDLPSGTRHVLVELCHIGAHYWVHPADATVPALAAGG